MRRVTPIQIPCALKACPANKDDTCARPELIAIGSQGVCKIGWRFLPTKTRVTRARTIPTSPCPLPT